MARADLKAARVNAQRLARARLEHKVGKDVDGLLFSESISAEGATVFAKACEPRRQPILERK